MTNASFPTETAAPLTVVAFANAARIAAGDLVAVAMAARRALEQDSEAALLVFNSETGRVIDLDLRGAESDIVARYASPAPKRGRPKLGVTAREVTLLPRHWEWLADQPGGASVTLRRLVEAARRLEAPAGRSRARVEAAYRFMVAMAGDRPGFEEASRALFAGDFVQLTERMSKWPADICDQTLKFAGVQAAADTSAAQPS